MKSTSQVGSLGSLSLLVAQRSTLCSVTQSFSCVICCSQFATFSVLVEFDHNKSSFYNKIFHVRLKMLCFPLYTSCIMGGCRGGLEVKIYHSKLKTELFTVAIHKGLNKIKFLRRVQFCQGNLDWRQGKVREMSGNFVLCSLYEP